MDKRFEQVKRLLNMVKAYHSTHGPMPMRVVSNHFGKTLNEVGGFTSIIEELRRDGTIQVYISRSGARVVTPGEADTANIPEGFVLYE